MILEDTEAIKRNSQGAIKMAVNDKARNIGLIHGFYLSESG
jgi:hypothetical protein